jgi:hypothetical protein
MTKVLYKTRVAFTVYAVTDSNPNDKLHELINKLSEVDTTALDVHWDEVEWEAVEGFQTLTKDEDD